MSRENKIRVSNVKNIFKQFCPSCTKLGKWAWGTVCMIPGLIPVTLILCKDWEPPEVYGLTHTPTK